MKKIVLKCLQIQAQMRILHWQTTSYAEHNAFGSVYDALDDKIDRLIEVTQGRYGRIMLGGLESITISDYGNLKFNVFILDIAEFFKNGVYTCGIDPKSDTDIVNIVEEIRAEIEKLKYLLTLK